MRVLLDTHIALWATANDPRLPSRARSLIADASVEVYFSPVSVTEIAGKHSIHPNEMPVGGAEARAAFLSAGYKELCYTSSHAATLDLLPSHHRDPFDRMLLAQAKDEEIFIVSHDKQFPPYGDYVISV